MQSRCNCNQEEEQSVWSKFEVLVYKVWYKQDAGIHLFWMGTKNTCWHHYPKMKTFIKFLATNRTVISTFLATVVYKRGNLDAGSCGKTRFILFWEVFYFYASPSDIYGSSRMNEWWLMLYRDFMHCRFVSCSYCIGRAGMERDSQCDYNKLSHAVIQRRF